MHDRHRNSVEKPERNVPPFLILEAVVLERERWPGKDLLHINEIDAVVFEIRPISAFANYAVLSQPIRVAAVAR